MPRHALLQRIQAPHRKSSQAPKIVVAPHQSFHFQNLLGLQKRIGNRAFGKLLGHTSHVTSQTEHGVDFSPIGAFSTSGAEKSAKANDTSGGTLRVGHPADASEHEAERVSEAVVGTGTETAVPSPIALMATGLNSAGLQRVCAECEEEKQSVARKAKGKAGEVAPPEVHAVLASRGRPLDADARSYFEQRFGRDFSAVRVHDDARAAESAQTVNARAYTVGGDIVFNAGEYAPGTFAGNRLLAHELVHAIQQGAAPRPEGGPNGNAGEHHAASNELFVRSGSRMLQRWPGDGMVVPGDCSWPTYLPLRGSVETAKAVVNMLGACSPGDSCLLLATKIAAITAEIAARVALDATCFKGGDTGHRQQVQDKINMLNRCYRFFSNSNCSPELVAAMAVVVDAARDVIAAAAVAVTIALAVALVAAIIALVEVIAGLLAAAAESTTIAEAIQALRMLLTSAMNVLPSGI
jgi:uncharacterized protein DUF4157/putative RNase toxin 16 of polymorphic toxin system